MQVISAPSAPPKKEVSSAEAAFNEGMRTALAEVESEEAEKVSAENPAPANEPSEDGLPEADDPVDVEEHLASDPFLAAASGDGQKYHEDARLTSDEGGFALAGTEVKVEEQHKAAFVESVLTGRRYVETFSLLGGKLVIRVRSRSTEETEAIQAYVRKNASSGALLTDYDYSSLMRKLLAVAQVEEINGVKYPEMARPLFFTEDEEGRTPPAWEGLLGAWSAKPEYILSMVTKCILEFEARYWHLIKNVDDVNFWEPGESTGK